MKRIVDIMLAVLLVTGYSAAMKVSGTITDAVTGNALPGVLVQIDKYDGRYPGFTTSVLTDALGKYTVDYSPSHIAAASDDIYLPENTLFTVYAADGTRMSSGVRSTALSQAAGQWSDGVYLITYHIDGEMYCDRLVISGACTSLPTFKKTHAARTAAAASLQTDTLLSFSKDGYTTQGIIKHGTLYNIQLHPRTAAGDLAGPGNTGPTGPLKLAGGSALVQGGVASGYYFAGSLVVTAANITLRNFIVDGGNLMYGVESKATGLVLEDGEIRNASSSVISGSNYTVRRVNLHESDADAMKAWTNVLVEKSWIHHIGRNPDAHADGLQMVQGSDVTLKDNNFNLGIKETGYHCSQVVIVQTNDGPVDNVLIEGNWINGGGFSLQSRDKGTGYGYPTNVKVIGNTFGTDYTYGVNVGAFAVWKDNIWFDGTPCPGGTYE